MRSSFGRRQISTILAPAILTASVVSVEAQTSTNGHLTSTNQAVFAPLDLPGSNEIRTQQGGPGPGNWPQSVSYTIRAALEPSRHRVTGSETISYTNN